ncbi:MAG: hypothetical protein ACOC9Z_08645, partial [Chloroflexota bacterium]
RSMPQEFAREGQGEVRKAIDEGKQAFKPVSRDTPRSAPNNARDGDGDDDAESKPPVPTPDSLPTPIDVPDDPE